MCSAKKITTERKTDRQSNQRSIWGFISYTSIIQRSITRNSLISVLSPLGMGWKTARQRQVPTMAIRMKAWQYKHHRPSFQATISGQNTSQIYPALKNCPLHTFRKYESLMEGGESGRYAKKFFLCHCCCKRNNKIDPELYLCRDRYSIICSFRELNIILK